MQLKIATAVFNCVKGYSPAYFRYVCVPDANICAVVRQISIRQNATTCLSIPLTRTQLGWWSFYIAAPVIWNAFRIQLHSSFISCWQFRDGLARSSAVVQRPCDASCLLVVSFNSIITWAQSIFIITLASDLQMHTIKFWSVVFGVMLKLLVINTLSSVSCDQHIKLLTATSYECHQLAMVRHSCVYNI